MRTIPAPTSVGTSFRTYFKLNGRSLVFCQAVPTSCYDLGHAVIPVHPIFLQGRTLDICKNFSTWALRKAILHYVPIVGTDADFSIAMTALPRCQPLTNIEAGIYNVICGCEALVGAGWSVASYAISDLPKIRFPMAPTCRDHVPYNFFLSTTPTQTLSDVAVLFLEVEVDLDDPVQNTEIWGSQYSGAITLSALGTQNNSVATFLTSSSIITASTVPSGDLGEFINMIPTPALLTDYPQPVVHNGSVFASASTSQDRGTFSGPSIYFN